MGISIRCGDDTRHPVPQALDFLFLRVYGLGSRYPEL